MVNVHATHAALNHAPREQTGAGIRRLGRVSAVELECLGAFTFQVHQLRRAGLQPIRHLVAVNARGNFGVVFNLQSSTIERTDQVYRVALKLGIHALGPAHVEDGIARVSKADPGMFARHEPGRPQRRAAADAAAGGKHNKSRQITRLGTETVTEPRTEARSAGLGKTGIEKNLPGRVIELIRVHRPDDGDVIDDLGQVRQFVGQLRAGLAVSRKAKPRPQHGGIALDKGVTLIADHRGRQRFALELFQLGLVIKQLQLARCAGLEKMNHPLGLGRKVGARPRLAKRPGQQPSQRNLAHPIAAFPKEVPPRNLRGIGGTSLRVR